MENKRFSLKWLIITAVILLLSYIFYRYSTTNLTPVAPSPTVIVKQPSIVSKSEYITQTGNTVAFNAVNLVARVEGYLQSVEFIDGSMVNQGQKLFIIEPEPYLEKLKAAQASVDASKAAYAYASAEYARQQQMYKANATSLNNVEKWYARREEYKAEIDKAIANARIAAINYSYTQVLAPFAGRIGRHLVDPGNLVGNGAATDLATLEQIDPIYVYFNLNELDLMRLRTAARQHKLLPQDISKIPAYVAMQNETNFPHIGKLNFVNTGLNASTGTMEFRALFANKDHLLLPGLFVEIRIPITNPIPRLIIPDQCVQYDQIGAYVYVADANNIVVVKRIVLGSVEQGSRTILQGLTTQDRVIIAGLQNAIVGNPVKIKDVSKN